MAYEAPSGNNVNLILTASYTAPAGDSIALVIVDPGATADITTGAPLVSAAGFGQTHILLAGGIVTAPPVVSAEAVVVTQTMTTPFEIHTFLRTGTTGSTAAQTEPDPIETTLSEIGDDAGISIVVIVATLTTDSTLSFDGSSGLILNIGESTYIYLCELTGYQNGLSNLEIPMESFQCTLRSDAQSYLQVVTPAYILADDIADRTDGDIRVFMCQVINGEIVNKTQIARVSFDYISSYGGSSSQAITMSGHMAAEAVTPQTITLRNSTYKSVSGGTTVLRFPQPDMYLRPGDTVICGDDSISVDQIVLYMSVTQQQMEVSGG